jgi:hypothetical protein
MVDVDVNIEDSLMLLEELEDGQYAVVDVAETGGFLPFGVVQAAAPVDGDVNRPLVDQVGPQNRTSSPQQLTFRVELAEVVELGVLWARAVSREAKP